MESLAEFFDHDFKNGSFYLFDRNGNARYYENIDGDWVKYEHDSNDNEIYCEDSVRGVVVDKRSPTLKSCPFCGSSNVTVGCYSERWEIRCKYCGAQIWEEIEEDAIQAWNNRNTE